MRPSLGESTFVAITQNPLGTAAVVVALLLVAAVGVLIRRLMSPWTRRGLRTRTEWVLLTYLIASIGLSALFNIPLLAWSFELRDVALDPVPYLADKLIRTFLLTLIAPFVWLIFALSFASGLEAWLYLVQVLGGATFVGAVLATAITSWLPRLRRRRADAVEEA